MMNKAATASLVQNSNGEIKWPSKQSVNGNGIACTHDTADSIDEERVGNLSSRVK